MIMLWLCAGKQSPVTLACICGLIHIRLCTPIQLSAFIRAAESGEAMQILLHLI